MVAYSFKAQFDMPIVSRRKRQTVRAKGKRRHARPGERVQLYVGLRTKGARKLIDDPICTRVDDIFIAVDTTKTDCLGRFELNGVLLTDAEMEDFARADGFDDLHQMGLFWFASHGEGLFHGVVIHWADA